MTGSAKQSIASQGEITSSSVKNSQAVDLESGNGILRNWIYRKAGLWSGIPCVAESRTVSASNA
jgi:hypothetical protein